MTNEKPISQKLFHWLFAFGFAGAYLSADDDTMWLHLALGFMVGALALLRLVLFLTGPKTWHLRTMNFSPADLKQYFLRYFNKPEFHANPAASYAALGLLLLALLTGASGYFSPGSDFMEETHEVLGNLFLFLALAHIAGVAADSLLHDGDTYKQMLGKSPLQPVMSALVVLVAVAGIAFSVSLDTSAFDDDHEQEHYEYDDD